MSTSSSIMFSKDSFPKPKSLKMWRDVRRNSVQVFPLENNTPGTDPKLNPLLRMSKWINDWSYHSKNYNANAGNERLLGLRQNKEIKMLSSIYRVHNKFQTNL